MIKILLLLKSNYKLILRIVVFLVCFIIVYNLFFSAWSYIAEREPGIKSKINSCKLIDSLNKEEIKSLNTYNSLLISKISVLDSIEKAQQIDLDFLQTKEGLHQKNQQDLKRLLTEYEKNGSCFVYKKEKIGFLGLKSRNVLVQISCDSLR